DHAGADRADEQDRDRRILAARDQRIGEVVGSMDRAVAVGDEERRETARDDAGLEHRERRAAQRERAQHRGDGQPAEAEDQRLAGFERGRRAERRRHEREVDREEAQEKNDEERAGPREEDRVHPERAPRHEAGEERAGGAAERGRQDAFEHGEREGDHAGGDRVDDHAQCGGEPRLVSLVHAASARVSAARIAARCFFPRRRPVFRSSTITSARVALRAAMTCSSSSLGVPSREPGSISARRQRGGFGSASIPSVVTTKRLRGARGRTAATTFASQGPGRGGTKTTRLAGPDCSARRTKGSSPAPPESRASAERTIISTASSTRAVSPAEPSAPKRKSEPKVPSSIATRAAAALASSPGPAT